MASLNDAKHLAEQLPPEDQAALFEWLSARLAGSQVPEGYASQAEFEAEITRRVQDVEQGAPVYSAASVVAEARALYGKKR